MSKNIYWHHSAVNRLDREKKNKHRSACLWLTGLSGSGKSTTSSMLEEELFKQGVFTYLLDGDNVRHGLNSDLGFSEKDRNENIRRIGEVAKLFVDAGAIVITSFISPYRQDRESVRKIFAPGDFIEIYVSCDLDVCEKRDPKGLYKKARQGEIANFTGISAPYEVPIDPEIIIETNRYSVFENVLQIIGYLKQNEYCKKETRM